MQQIGQIQLCYGKLMNKADDQRQLQLAFRHDIIFGKRKEIAVFFFGRFLKFHQRT